ncbi:MAG: nucleotidyltransferase domain-containing protein [Patescibacteria group bacterium]
MDKTIVNQKLPFVINKIVVEFKPEKIILFGSYAWGHPNRDSDIDLFVVKKTSETRIERGQIIENLLWGCGLPVDTLVYTPEEVQKRFELNDFFILNIFDKGKVLYSAN